MRKVVFRDEANAELTALYEYIANRGNPETAIRYIRRIREACISLAHFPERGTRRDDLLPGLRVIGFERRVTIAFRVTDSKVEIVTVVYGGRDVERRFVIGE